MISLDKAVIARLESHGESFEILVDPNIVEKVHSGEITDIREHLAVEDVFKDARKGDRASEESVKKVFGTEDINEIAIQIIKKGEVQLTTEQRRKMQEEKKRKIITEIARNAINPQTKTPHPPARIEAAMEEARIHIDPFKPAEQQVQKVLDAIKPIIPIKFEKIRVAIKLSGENYGKAYGEIVNYGKIIKEEWQADGSWIGLVEIPAGVQIEFFDELNKRTKGDVETKLLNS
jgi:ribosome maturation protein SDO1